MSQVLKCFCFGRYEKQLEQEEQAYQQQRRRLYSEVQEEKERLTEQLQKAKQETTQEKNASEVGIFLVLIYIQTTCIFSFACIFRVFFVTSFILLFFM